MNELKLIGRGLFTKAYLRPIDNRVVLKSTCPIKECMALGWFPNSELFPKLDYIESNVYEMEYLPRPKSLKQNLDKDQYVIYQTLRRVYNDKPYSLNKNDSCSSLYKLFETIEDSSLSTIMCKALNACSNMGSDIDFEISPRNVSVKNGKLILLDVFYSISEMQKIRSSKR